MFQLSEHFTLEEFVQSEIAARRGIKNIPNSEIVTRLGFTAAQMEKVRIFLGAYPISVSSGYRCAELNLAVGGAPNSAHIQGWAVDFICPRFGSPREICMEIVNGFDTVGFFDQLIFEWTWVHLSFAPEMRRSVITRNEQGYIEGIA